VRPVDAIDAIWLAIRRGSGSLAVRTIWPMREYFLRRLLLLFPTLLVITVIVFCITRIAPGGPLEQAMMEMQQVSLEGGGGSTEGGLAMSEEQLQQMKELYGYDKPIFEAYVIWLGLKPRELNRRNVEFKDGETKANARMRIPPFHVAELDWDGDGYLQRAEVPAGLDQYVKFDQLDINRDGQIDGLEADVPEAQIERARERVHLRRDASGGVRITNPEALMVNWKVRMREPPADDPDAKPKAELYRTRYAGVLQGDLGKSFRHGEPVSTVMLERLPVSTFYGLLTFLITFLVCVPLGIAKAMRHNTWFDNGTSVFIFMGYAVPGYVLGALLVVFLAARWEVFPTGGFVGDNFHDVTIESLKADADSNRLTVPRKEKHVEKMEITVTIDFNSTREVINESKDVEIFVEIPGHQLSNGDTVWFEGQLPSTHPPLARETEYYVKRIDDYQFTLHTDPALEDAPVDLKESGAVVLHRWTSTWEKTKDLAWHAVLPLCCYLVGSFAFVTMLMKNHLMDNLSADYMRTAIAKGVPFSQAVRHHALRNSLIPLATNLGHQITIFVAGSFLIETIFDINGFGLLGFKSVLDRDIPVVMGIFLLSATLMLIGNIISDILVALVDPRVRFN
jgi:ABC-type dipeptide/oligopeptide/nickel transport system permease component